MLAGKLNHRFAFDKRPITTDDGYGNVQGDWEEQFKTWAGKRYIIGGGEAITAARLSGHQPVIIRLRCSPLTESIETSWRCRDLITEEVFNIRSITPYEKREGYIDLLIESGVAEG